MPELKNIKIEYEEEDTSQIQFKDKKKEKERLEKIANFDDKMERYCTK